MELTYESLHSAVLGSLHSAQHDFAVMPSAVNWNRVTAAMFVYQQARFTGPRSRADLLEACEGKQPEQLADAIGVAFYGSPWVELQREFFQ